MASLRNWIPSHESIPGRLTRGTTKCYFVPIKGGRERGKAAIRHHHGRHVLDGGVRLREELFHCMRRLVKKTIWIGFQGCIMDFSIARKIPCNMNLLRHSFNSCRKVRLAFPGIKDQVPWDSLLMTFLQAMHFSFDFWVHMSVSGLPYMKFRFLDSTLFLEAYQPF